jgi:hypothetical protein
MTENLYKEYYEFQRTTAKAVKEQQTAWDHKKHLEYELSMAEREYSDKRYKAEQLTKEEDQLLARIQELEKENDE